MKLRALLLLPAIILSSVSFAESYEGKEVHKQINRAGLNLEGESVYNFELRTDVYRITSEYRWVEDTVWECTDGKPGDGSSSNWNGFFNAPKSEKASALAGAIKGIGLSTAKKLVEDNAFSSKPRSWSAFSRIINDADDRYMTGFSQEVLVKFKKENMEGLGYNYTDGNCGFVTKRQFRRIPVKRFHKTVDQTFVVTISGAPLLPSETETITVAYDGLSHDIRVQSRFNSYNYNKFSEGDRVVFELTADRARVAPVNDIYLSAKEQGGRLILNVQDKNFVEDADVDARRYLVATIKNDGFLINKKLGDIAVELNANQAETTIENINVPVKKGQKILIQYRLEVRNSAFYNNDLSGTKTLKTKL